MPDISFGSYTLPVYIYEGFSYTIQKPFDLSSITVSNSTGLPTAYFTVDLSTGLTFSTTSASNNLTIGTEAFSATFVGSGSNVVSSNIVEIGAGRFTDLSGMSVSNNSYTFYNKEPISKIQLQAPFNLSPVSSVPTLPPGLAFYVSGSNVDISGTPLTTVPTSNYLIIGKQLSGSKIVTTSINISISNERILYNLSGSPIISGMTVGTPITPRTLTASFPPYPSGGTLRYIWPSLPDGIQVLDVSGNPVSSLPFGYPSIDPSHVLTIAGTPTSNAVYNFVNLDISSETVTFQGTRINPLPAITSNIAFTFSFAETVLFDQSSTQSLYTLVPIVSGSEFFRAQTYFATGAGTVISNIFSPDLRADLSLSFNSLTAKATLTGTPLSAGSATYTITAINSNGVSTNYPAPITVQDDVVTFVSPSPAVDTCYNFIFSRPVDLGKLGYYTSNIRFVATALSRLPVTLSAPALVGTGLSLNSNGVITGVPNTVTSLTNLVVGATVTGSPATGSRQVKFEIIPDTFTFAPLNPTLFNFVQNRAIAPFQVSVTTLSERNILGYSSTGFPQGVSISPAGVVSGTPLTLGPSPVSIVATTGYSSGSNIYAYNVTPDNILFRVEPNTYQYAPGDSVDIQVSGTAYSGITVSNFSLSLVPTYGLSIGSTGNITGSWIDGNPPNVLPASCNFTVNAVAGALVDTLDTTFTTVPATVNAVLFVEYGVPIGETAYDSYIYYTSVSNLSTWSEGPISLPGGFVASKPITDIQIKYTDNLYSNVILAVVNGGKSEVSRMLRGSNLKELVFTPIEPVPNRNPGVSTVINKPGTSTWWAAGSLFDGDAESYYTALIPSIDDGLTWDVSGAIKIRTGLGGSRVLTRDYYVTGASSNPYVSSGVAVKYKDGVIMAGGQMDVASFTNILRSTDDGITWSNVTGDIGEECASFNLEDESVWVVTGSDRYASWAPTAYSTSAMTIKYSIDAGVSWNNTTGGFNMFGYELAYGGGTWLATGVSGSITGPDETYRVEVRYSMDGIDWDVVGEIPTVSVGNNLNTPQIAPLPFGSMSFDGTHWNVFCQETDIDTGISYTNVYRHDLLSSFASAWTKTDVTSYFPGTSNALGRRFFSFTTPHYLLNDTGTPTITLEFATGTSGTGPTVTSPTQFSYLLYQYIAIDPIQITGVGIGVIYVFVENDALPPGLVFSPVTNQITGTPAQIGTTTARVYVKDDAGVTAIDITFKVVIPRIIRAQDGAGAYTSLLRQYTEVLGAQGGRDNRALPNQERALGEFMSPEGPDVITQTFCPDCK